MEANQTLMRIVRVLTHVIDAADPHSRGRSLRISRYAVRVARELGVPDSAHADIELGAMLHDLGRYAILNDVVQTPRPLDAGERAMVQTHPTIGWEMLHDIPGLAGAAEIVYAHHERPDGKGYPRQLHSDDVPVGARIIMVCAAYEAMTEERPYRRLRTVLRRLPPLSPAERLYVAALVPLIRVVGDVAKMIGYPVGWRWRLRHRPSDWRIVRGKKAVKRPE